MKTENYRGYTITIIPADSKYGYTVRRLDNSLVLDDGGYLMETEEDALIAAKDEIDEHIIS